MRDAVRPIVHRFRTALVALGGFAVLAVAVELGLLDAWDVAVRHLARPNEAWGPVQIRADYVVEGLRPTMLVAPMVGATTVACWLWRSLRPAVVAAVGVTVTVLATLGTKWLLARPDPGNTTSGHGGSFPSGHTVAVTVCTGLVVLLFSPMLSPSARRWTWVFPAVLGVTMASSMVLQGAHWASDVIGGLLLATALLAAFHGLGSFRRLDPTRSCRIQPTEPTSKVRDS